MLDGIWRDGEVSGFEGAPAFIGGWAQGGSSCRDNVLYGIIYWFEIAWRLCGRLCGLGEIGRDVRHVDACLSTPRVKVWRVWIVPHAGRN